LRTGHISQTLGTARFAEMGFQAQALVFRNEYRSKHVERFSRFGNRRR